MSQSIYIALAGLLSIASMPVIIKFCKKLSLYDYQNARKIHSGNIPRLGGVGIFFSFLVSSLIFIIKANPAKISEMNLQFRLNANLLKYLFVLKTEKDA